MKLFVLILTIACFALAIRGLIVSDTNERNGWFLASLGWLTAAFWYIASSVN